MSELKHCKCGDSERYHTLLRRDTDERGKCSRCECKAYARDVEHAGDWANL